MTITANHGTQRRLAIENGSPDLFEMFRNGLSSMFRWELPRGRRPAGFNATAAGVTMDGFTFSSTTMTGGDLVRDRRVLAESGAAPILIQAYRSDPFAYVAGRQSGIIPPGEIAVFDLGRPLTITTTQVSNITLTVQRGVIEPLVHRLDGVNGRILPRRHRLTRLLFHHINAFATRFEDLDADEAAIVAAATPGLVAACLGPSEDGRERARAAVRLAVFNLIREEIDRRLGDPRLGVEAILSGFGLSRSALYRLFEPFGGVARYIAGRRLARIHRLLRDPAFGDRTVAEIAAAHGYSNPSAFSRAFHRAYGVRPTDLRTGEGPASWGAPLTTGNLNTFTALREWADAL